MSASKKTILGGGKLNFAESITYDSLPTRYHYGHHLRLFSSLKQNRIVNRALLK